MFSNFFNLLMLLILYYLNHKNRIIKKTIDFIIGSFILSLLISFIWKGKFNTYLLTSSIIYLAFDALYRLFLSKFRTNVTK